MALLLAFALAMGVDLRRLTILALAVYVPLAIVVGLIPVVMAGARRSDPRAAVFCEGVASELRSGALLSHAVAAAAEAVDADGVASSAREGNMVAAAAAAGVEFPGLATELQITILRAGSTGAAAADLFDEIGSLALAQEELRREVKVASAPARAAVVVFVVLPAAYLISRAMGGDLAELFVETGQRVVATLGLGLFLLGLAVSGALVWRAR